MAGRYSAGVAASATVTDHGNGPAPVRAGSPNSWHPTVAYLMFLVVCEYAALVLLRYVFRHAHGG